MHRTNRIIYPLSFIFMIGLLVTLIIPLATQATQAASSPTVTGFAGVQANQSLAGRVNIQALVAGQSIAKVVFQLSGPKSNSQTEKIAPYTFFGDINGVPNGWDTTSYPNGSYTLKATVSDTAGHSNSKSIAFEIANTSVPQPTATNIPATATSVPQPTATNIPTTVTPVVSSSLIYGDALASGWENWSWSTSVAFNATNPKHSGAAAMSVTYSAGWGGLFLHAAQPLPTSGYDRLRFWIHGGSGNQRLQVLIRNGSDVESSAVDVAPQAGTWKQIDLPLSAFGSPDAIGAIIWQDSSGGAQPTFYIDDLALVFSGSTPAPTATPLPSGNNGPALSVDANADQHAISELIYGMNFPSEALARELRIPVQRWGGNATTRYNWQNDTSNRASDWFFENIPNENANPGALPDGSSTDAFIEQGRRTGTQTLLTIPMIGWTPKSRDITCGFAVSRYGAQQQTDSYRLDCGNGVASNGTAITGNTPQDTSTAIGPAFVQDWMRHLIGRYGTAAQGGVQLYNLDNEPALWNSTHRDVHPQGISYDELRDRTYQYAAAIKAIDPSAQTLGPAEWGWTGYFYSAKDQQPGGNWWNNPLDRNAHAGTPLVDWYLQQMR
ncbi:MAG: glycoside hydrolase family 44 protein, partial [Roseiflexaceae bacterium]